MQSGDPYFFSRLGLSKASEDDGQESGVWSLQVVGWKTSRACWCKFLPLIIGLSCGKEEEKISMPVGGEEGFSGL